jgi:hypothetical protein
MPIMGCVVPKAEGAKKKLHTVMTTGPNMSKAEKRHKPIEK